MIIHNQKLIRANRLIIMLVAICLPVIVAAQQSMMPITTSSDEARSLFMEARDKFVNADRDGAAILLKKAMKLDPDFAMAQLHYAFSVPSADAYYRNFSKALSLIDQISKAEKDFILYFDCWAKEDTLRQRQYLDELLTLYPTDKWILLLAGSSYLTSLEPAMIYYNKALKLDPDFAPAYYEMALKQMGNGQLDQAEQNIKMYIKLLPDHPNPYYSYALLLRKMGKTAEALEQFKLASKKDRNFISSLREAGHLYCLKGDFENAYKMYQKYEDNARLSERKTNAMYWQAVAYVYEGNMPKVLAIYDRYQKFAEREDLGAFRVYSFSDLGDIYTEMGQPAEGMKYYKKAIALIGQVDLSDQMRQEFDLEALRWQATELIVQGEFDKAEQLLKKYELALADCQYPASNRPLTATRARLAMAKGDFDAALQLFDESKMMDPIIAHMQAEIYAKKGETEKADAIYQKIANWGQNSMKLALVMPRVREKLASQS